MQYIYYKYASNYDLNNNIKEKIQKYLIKNKDLEF